MHSECLDVRRILVLEDSSGEGEPPCHTILVPSTFFEAPPQAYQPWIDVRHSATDALNSMRKQAELEPRNLPLLIVVDLDLPRRTSLSFLQTLRQDPCLKNLPVMVLAWPEKEGLVRSLYGLGISAYVIKPVRFADLLAVAGQLYCKWHPDSSGPALCYQDRIPVL
jgi:CheY-like chemotaxis protein